MDVCSSGLSGRGNGGFLGGALKTRKYDGGSRRKCAGLDSGDLGLYRLRFEAAVAVRKD